MNYPSNPTGSTFTETELIKISEIVKKNNLIVVSDEIYDKILYDGIKHTSFIQISDEIKKRTILVNGVSKTYSMTGWRIGYAAGNSDVILSLIHI